MRVAIAIDPPNLPFLARSSLTQVIDCIGFGRMWEERELFGNEDSRVCARGRARESYLVKTLPSSLANNKTLKSLDCYWLFRRGGLQGDAPLTLQRPP